MRASNITRRFNLPPSYVLIHRVSTAGIGVLCQLECEGEFRAEVLKWIPGYSDPTPIGSSGDPSSPEAAGDGGRSGAGDSEDLGDATGSRVVDEPEAAGDGSLD
jgi:hypothetical protein